MRLARRAQRFFVGKRAGRHALSQAAIHAVMIRAAKRGRRVVRLKGGDPFVFGRGGEEALALDAAGVPFDIVPGVSSAVAAPALAGIPVTHRGLASAFLVVSGHDEDVFARSIGQLTPNGLTLVVLMGVGRRAALAARLIDRGWSRETPAAIVADASLPQQQVWRGTLDDLASDRAATGGRRPRDDRDRRRGGAGADHRRCDTSATAGEGAQALRNQDTHMSSSDNTSTHGRTRLSFASVADIDEFVATLERYERGELTPDQWRAFRLVRGTYGQRQAADAQMLRIKVPQGILTSDQLAALADVGERYSRRFGHITTRQNIQFHFVKLHDAEPAMRRLAEAGLTTREACGNSVRNITACPYAGVAADERFDVTPYAEAIDAVPPASPAQLHAAAQVQDRLRRVRTRITSRRRSTTSDSSRSSGPGGARGFRVVAGGGTAIMCKSAGILHDFHPGRRSCFRVAEAVLRVFHRLGDYQHKQRNRMKFMIKELGWDRWRAEYERELAACRGEAGRPLLTIEPPAAESPLEWRKDAPPSPSLIASRVAAAPPRGPGITPELVPVYHAAATKRTCGGAPRTSARRSSSAT